MRPCDSHGRFTCAAARANVALVQEQLAAAEEEYKQMFELYRGQEATALDAEASEAALGEARRASVSGRLELRLAELRVWAASGSLQEILSQEVR